MTQRINEWIIDFMNLVFGVGEETRQFWEEVLLPEVSAHYGFSLGELYKFERNLNALYFSLCEQINLKVTEKPGANDTPTNENATRTKSGFQQSRTAIQYQGSAQNINVGNFSGGPQNNGAANNNA